MVAAAFIAGGVRAEVVLRAAVARAVGMEVVLAETVAKVVRAGDRSGAAVAIRLS